MKKLAAGTLASILLFSSAADAAVRPQGTAYDHRVRYVSYNPDDVVTIIGHFGFSTAIEFAPDETVVSVALGDSLAWDVAPRGNFLFVKPRESRPTTNMTVVTNRRAYQFWMDAHASRSKGHANDVFFAVKFRYPMDEAKAAADAAERRRAEQALAAAPTPNNWNYWACGSKTLRPTEVFDDGRFTYMRFPAAQEIPAAYIINSDGAEAMASGFMRGDQLVLQVVAPKIVLRKGKSAACVQNRSYNPYGVYTPTGTTSPQVERVLQAPAGAPPALPVRPRVEPAADPEANAEGASPAIPGLPPGLILPPGTTLPSNASEGGIP